MIRMFVVAALVLSAGAARAAEDGAALFKKRCAACHGQNAEGAKMRPEPIAGEEKAEVKEVITKGKGRMKPIPGLTPEQADAIAEYVSKLKKS
jgi:mono/diheme cytochrome c family protein